MTDCIEIIIKSTKLAAIKLTEDEINSYAEHIKNMRIMLDNFANVNTEGIEPLKSISNHNLELRDDVAIDPHSSETVFPSANNVKHGYFRTPKFVD